MLCVSALRNLDESYLLATVEKKGFEETIVDSAMAYIESLCEEHPALAMEKAALLKEAGGIVEAWETRHVRLIKLLLRGISRRCNTPFLFDSLHDFRGTGVMIRHASLIDSNLGLPQAAAIKATKRAMGKDAGKSVRGFLERKRVQGAWRKRGAEA